MIIAFAFGDPLKMYLIFARPVVCPNCPVRPKTVTYTRPQTNERGTRGIALDEPVSRLKLSWLGKLKSRPFAYLHVFTTSLPSTRRSWNERGARLAPVARVRKKKIIFPPAAFHRRPRRLPAGFAAQNCLGRGTSSAGTPLKQIANFHVNATHSERN